MLDVEGFLKQAELQYLLHAETKFVFPVRRSSGEKNFYEALDLELRSQSFLKIQSYRMVKEGWTKVSRPAELGFELEALLTKRPYLKSCKNKIEKLKTSFPEIDVIHFLKQNHDLLTSLEIVEASLEVLNYLIQNRSSVSGLLPRQIPHGQSTKLIRREPILLRLFSFWRKELSTWKGFFDFFLLLDKPIEFRFFSPSCFIQEKQVLNHHGVLAPEWCADFNFEDLNATLIIENIESFYSASKHSKNTLLLWGAGWRVSQIKFLLHLLPQPIFYWGDIDKEGYEIFGFLQRFFPLLQPLFMSATTIQKYKHLMQKKEKYSGPLRMIEGLQEEYEMVARNGIQIEQEQLSEAWPFISELI